MARSISILAEQKMIGDLLTCHYLYATLEHSHLELAKMLSQKSIQAPQIEGYSFLSKVSFGVVTHCYPHPANLYVPEEELSSILKWLVHPESVNLNDMHELALQTLHLLNRNQVQKPDDAAALELAMQTPFYSSDKIERKKVNFPEMSEKISPLISAVEDLLKTVHHSRVQLNEVKGEKVARGDEQYEILLNIQYHFHGLADSLECFYAFQILH